MGRLKGGHNKPKNIEQLTGKPCLPAREVSKQTCPDSIGKSVVQVHNLAPILIAHQRIIRDKLNEMSPIPNEELHVRNAIVKEITKEDAKPIILKYEWLGTMAITTRHYGIFYSGHCAGVVCFGNAVAGNSNIEKFFKLDKKEVWNLARGACVSWSPKNTNSKLIGESLKLFSKNEPLAKVVIAYADPSAGEIGTVYQATNWYYIGRGRSRKCVIDKDNKIISSRAFNNTNEMEEYIKIHQGSKILSEGERLSKGRYIFILNRKDKKYIMSIMQKNILPYPKRTQNEGEKT